LQAVDGNPDEVTIGDLANDFLLLEVLQQDEQSKNFRSAGATCLALSRGDEMKSLLRIETALEVHKLGLEEEVALLEQMASVRLGIQFYWGYDVGDIEGLLLDKRISSNEEDQTIVGSRMKDEVSALRVLFRFYCQAHASRNEVLRPVVDDLRERFCNVSWKLIVSGNRFGA